MKKVLLFGAALALICGAGFSFAQGGDQGPEEIKMANGSNPVTFPHRDHQTRLKQDCGICHHGKTADGKQEKYEKGKTKSQKCGVCHNKNADGISLDGKVPGMSPTQRAGHGRCQACHKEQQSTKNPPVNLMACGTCHKK